MVHASKDIFSNFNVEENGMTPNITGSINTSVILFIIFRGEEDDITPSTAEGVHRCVKSLVISRRGDDITHNIVNRLSPPWIVTAGGERKRLLLPI